MTMPTELTFTQQIRMERARLLAEAQLAQAKEIVDAAFPQAPDGPALMCAITQALAMNYLAEVEKAKI